MFLVEYSSNGLVVALTTGDAKGPNQIEITRDQYVDLMGRPHQLNTFRINAKHELVRYVEVKRSMNPMHPVATVAPGVAPDILITLGELEGGIASLVNLDHSVILLGTKRNNPQARPFRIEFKVLNGTTKYSRKINPADYDWFIHHPVESFLYSVVIL